MKCKYCGVGELTTGDIDGMCASCRNLYAQLSAQPRPFLGWSCPRCGSIYGPAQTECYRCNPPLKVTC